MVSNVLSRMEDFKSKAIQKFSLGKKATYWFESPSCLGFQELRNIIELGDLGWTKSYMFLELVDSPVVFFACISFE